MGESLIAMYRYQTTSQPRLSLGRRIDLSEYRDPNFLQNLPQPSSPVTVQTTVLSSSPSSSLPPTVLPEPTVVSQPPTQPPITIVEITTAAPPDGQLFMSRNHTKYCSTTCQEHLPSRSQPHRWTSHWRTKQRKPQKGSAQLKIVARQPRDAQLVFETRNAKRKRRLISRKCCSSIYRPGS